MRPANTKAQPAASAPRASFGLTYRWIHVSAPAPARLVSQEQPGTQLLRTAISYPSLAVLAYRTQLVSSSPAEVGDNDTCPQTLLLPRSAISVPHPLHSHQKDEFHFLNKFFFKNSFNRKIHLKLILL